MIKRDPQLAEHYKNLDLSKAHIVTLDHDVVAYVSYRLDRGIYWQAKPTIIAQGEQVITDGTTFIRARCGNRISYVPSFPTSLGEPEDTDTAVPVEFVAPPAPADPTTGNLTNPGAPPPVPPLVGDLPIGSPAQSLPGGPVPGGSVPPALPPCCFSSSKPPSQPPLQFSADEFSTIPLTILGHSYNLPSEEMALLAGILLVVALRLALWR